MKIFSVSNLKSKTKWINTLYTTMDGTKSKFIIIQNSTGIKQFVHMSYCNTMYT